MNEENKKALEMHAQWHGKIEIATRVAADNAQAMTLCYTPGVAEPCLEIAKDKTLAKVYTRKWNTVAIVTDGSAVLGLGNIGPEAALPVMEGKAVLFKQFGNVDAIPLCLDTTDEDEIVRTIELIAPGLGGVNLEDIAAPRCFSIERKLQEKLDIPVFHDDQHGTAIVVLAALINAGRILCRDEKALRIIINGAGAAGIAIAGLLLRHGIRDIILCDKHGIIGPEDNPVQAKTAKTTNPRGVTGTLIDALCGADVFIGVSGANLLSREMISRMAKDPIVFAMANPNPEILPEDARAAGAVIVGTGRSDYPNQINNVLAFPGVFRGALDCGAKRISWKMREAAAQAIADVLTDDERSTLCILPSPFDPRVCVAVADAVKRAKEIENI